MVKTIIRLVVALATLGTISWIGGLLCYTIALHVFFREIASSGDWAAVVYWSGVVFAPFTLFVVWPLMLMLSHDYGDGRRFIVFPSAGAIAGLVPTVLVGLIWGARSVVSPEAFLFAAFFCTGGAIFAAGYALALGWIHV